MAAAPTAAPEAEPKSCMICMDDRFNKTTRAPTECPHCHEVLCRTCLKQTLLNGTAVDTCCPGCRAVWSQEFLVTSVPVTFRTGDLKKHREKVLFDHEKIRLPDYLDDARRYADARVYRYGLNDRFQHLAEHVTAGTRDPGIIAAYNDVRAKRYLIESYGASDGSGIVGGAGAAAAPPKPRVVMPCPGGGCRGYINTTWSCGLCDVSVCADCRVIKADAHECKPDDVATARMIANDSRPCPTCAASISKISGCDQMWCTLCHTAFSWTTGVVHVGVIHNPHFFQWQATRGVQIPRADVPGVPCDVDGRMFSGATRLGATNPQVRDIMERHRQRLELESVGLRSVRDSVRAHVEGAWRRILCVKHLAGELSEADWQKELQIAEKKHHKERAWLHLMEMYVVTTRDILGRIVTDDAPDLNDIIAQHNRLLEFASQQSAVIAKTYQCIWKQLVPMMTKPC